MSRDHSLSLATLEKIARALDVPIERFFDPAEESPLDAELRRRTEIALHALMTRMATMPRAEVRRELLALLSGLFPK